MKIFFQIFVLIIICYSNSSAQFSILWNNSTIDTVDMGICYHLDSLDTKFKIINDSNDDAWISNQSPCYISSKSENDNLQPNDQWFRFLFKEINSRGITLKSKSNFEQSIRFNAEPRPGDTKFGRKEMRLTLGVVKGQFSPNDSVVLISKNYLVIARIGEKALGTYETNAKENVINFDSVYINPKEPPLRFLNIKNISNLPLIIDSVKFQQVSNTISGNELSVNLSKDAKLQINPKDIIEPIQISYSPKDLLADTANYKFYFYDDINSKYDSTNINLLGIGVTQEVSIKTANYPYSRVNNFDVFKLDDKPTYSVDTLSIVFSNSGNIPIEFIDVEIQKTYGDFSYNVLSKPNFAKHLQPKSLDSIKIEITSLSSGFISGDIKLKTKLSGRGIKHFPASAEEIIFKFNTISLSPKINLSVNELNFGNLFGNQQCNITGDTIVMIQNVGNEILYLFNPIANPSNLFQVKLEQDFIEPAESISATFSFLPPSEGFYSGTFTIQTNEIKDSLHTILLIGSGIKPISSTIHLADVMAMPGTQISIPIYITDPITNLSNRFRDTILYDSTLIRFNSVSSIGYAADGYSTILSSIREIKPGQLLIDIVMPSSRYFTQKDTLIKINFNTYLGEAEFTPISFTAPTFYDKTCPGIINLSNQNSINNGKFELDSVCGINLKLHKKQTNQLVSIISPNPTNDYLNISWNKTDDTKIKIVNFYGEEVAYYISKENNISVNLVGYPSGIYYAILQSSYGTNSQKFIIMGR